MAPFLHRLIYSGAEYIHDLPVSGLIPTAIVIPAKMVSKSYVISAVSKSFVGGLASKALFLMSEHATQMADKAEYTANAVAGVSTLQSWYNSKTGLWDSTGWWNSANCLTVLSDFASLGFHDQNGLNIADVIQTTYEQARK